MDFDGMFYIDLVDTSNPAYGLEDTEADDLLESPNRVLVRRILDSQTGNQLILYYGAIPAGNYWYDPVSGLWGASGGPSSGQIYPGLVLGGALEANASGGGTGVFINGRELHPSEVAYLQRLYGSVVPGRYWMNAQMIGGFEGGPAIFNLSAAGGGGSGGSGYNRNTIGGGLMSDGNCAGYLHPGGASVMTGNC